MSNSVNLTSQRISFVNKISILQKALSDDEIPTPIYLYKEINDISFESIGYCESLVEFLVDRLRHNSCHVKLKVLKVMKHILDHGSQNALLGLRHQVSHIKECVKFSGPPHSVHGNTPYVMVRNLAVELCERLYNMDPLALKVSGNNMDSVQTPPSKYSGMGPSLGRGTIQGFGNSALQPSKGIAGTILHEIEKLGTRLSETPADRQAAVLARLNLSASSSNYKPPVISSDIGGMSTLEPEDKSPPPLEQTVEKTVYRHLPGKAGGGWNDDEDEDELRHSAIGDKNVEENKSGEESVERLNCCSLTATEPKKVHSQDLHEEEKKLVEDLLKGDASMSTQRPDFLSNTAITDFLQKFNHLKVGVVLDFICHYFCHDDPSVSFRSLQLLEGIINHPHELININLLALQCKTELSECYGKAGKTASEMNEIDTACGTKWKAVQTKAAKLILIFQQLSCHKNIIPTSDIAQELFSSTPPYSIQHKQEVTLS